jgi:hypothetical protein
MNPGSVRRALAALDALGGAFEQMAERVAPAVVQVVTSGVGVSVSWFSWSASAS